MMRDFTLVIPTYNRAQSLAALLSYLETEKADCRILVLDSSRPETLAANRVRVASSSLDVEFAEFADLEPAEKWRQGIHQVTTSFCALCADDDILILAGVQRCLDALRTNLSASTVQGYSFTFLPRSDGDMELNNIVYFRPTIDDASPLQRRQAISAISSLELWRVPHSYAPANPRCSPTPDKGARSRTPVVRANGRERTCHSPAPLQLRTQHGPFETLRLLASARVVL